MAKNEVKEIEKEVEPKGESEARKNYRKLIEAYKQRNPEKYELKKEELDKKLAAIK